jgi:hypothetical protein
VVLALSACGSAAAPTASPTPPTTIAARTTTTAAATGVTTTQPPALTRAEQAAKFLKIVAPLNAEVDALDARYPKGPSTMAEALPIIKPLATFDDEVLRIGLTGQAAVDARALVTADEATIVDIQTSDGSEYNRDTGTVDSADNALRADLGLPAANPT